MSPSQENFKIFHILDIFFLSINSYNCSEIQYVFIASCIYSKVPKFHWVFVVVYYQPDSFITKSSCSGVKYLVIIFVLFSLILYPENSVMFISCITVLCGFLMGNTISSAKHFNLYSSLNFNPRYLFVESLVL